MGNVPYIEATGYISPIPPLQFLRGKLYIYIHIHMCVYICIYILYIYVYVYVYMYIYSAEVIISDTNPLKLNSTLLERSYFESHLMI